MEWPDVSFLLKRWVTEETAEMEEDMEREMFQR